MARGDHLDVDFVVDDADPEVDEEMLEPPSRANRRRQVIVGLVVAALLAAGLGARVITSDGSSPVAAKLSSSAPGSSVAVAAPSLAAASATPTPTDPATCPEAGDGQSACSRSTALSAGVASAVRAHFPGAVVESGFTEQLRDTGYGPGGLWYRQVQARVGALSIRVVVRHRVSGDQNAPANGSDNGASSDVTVVRVSTGLTVEVRAYGRSGLPQQLVAATALADDQRLRAL